MKTKNLMTAFALSAMFAACSQDAELNEVIAKNDFSNVPVVEAEFTANIGAESRMTNQFGWELGDKVGLAWLGDGQYVKPENEDFKGIAFQNHPLFCVDTDKKAFKTETMLFVGDYYAYMPYTEGNMTVEFIKFDIAKQPLTANSDDLAEKAIYLSTKNVTLQKAKSDGTVDKGNQEAGMGNNVKLNLALVNNPTKIDFTFKNVETLTDLKVTGVTINMYNTYSTLPLTVNGFTRANMSNDWTEYSSTDFYGYSPATTGAVTLEGELAVVDNALTTYALLLPVSTIVEGAGHKMVINLTTNYGNVTLDNVKVNNTKVFTHFGQMGVVATVEVDGKNIKKTTATAKTQAELDEILTQLEELGQTDPVAITLNPATAASPEAAFVLTDFTLPANLKSVVTLTAGGKTNGTIEFAGNTVINKQIVVTSPINVKGNMTVADIANKTTLNCVNLTVDHDAVLTNNGSISGHIKTVAADEEEELGFGKYINNYKNAKVDCEIENLGEAQWIAGTVPARVTGTNNVYAEVTNLAGIKAASTAGVTFVRLMDGAAIYNQTEDYTYSNIGEIECYGNVTFYITDTPSGVTKSISFWANVEMTVKEGAVVNVGSDNKNNALTIKTIKVEEGALFSASNIILPATINNAGGVSLYNVQAFVKGTQGEGSSWSAQESN